MATRRATKTEKPEETPLAVGGQRKRTRAKRPKVAKAQLEALIEEAVVDAYGDHEQQMGLFTMLQDHLNVPFETEVLGVPVQVIEIEYNDANEIVALCKHGRHVQRIPVVDLPLPEQPPEGFEWIEAYRLFRSRCG
jgi:hypothetical protein